MVLDAVLQEKLRAPEARGLVRERLEQPMVSDEPGGLNVVVAPAGSGKTTLLARVAAAMPVPVGWYRITADDAAEDRLVAHLRQALAPITDVADATSMTDVLAGLDRWSGPSGALILDDLHEIAYTPAERALERLVSLRPQRLRLIFGSRRMPDVNIPRIRVSGSIREIGSDDLRFRSWEVEELFASVYNQPLRPEAAAALTRRTGGWAAGLQLFHLSTAGRTVAERHQAVFDLAGRSKLVRSYLTRNVLAELAEDRREFLVKTCTLGRLSGATCDELLNTTGSHRILEQLEDSQLFTSTDDGGSFYRYHEILQTHLELALVEDFGIDEARALYHRSGQVLEAAGDLRAAARAYAKAGDWAALSKLVCSEDGNGIDASHMDDDHLLPASTWHHDPWLAVANARRLVREGALEAAANAYKHAQSLYEEPNFHRLCRDEHRAVTMWLPGYDGRSRSDQVSAQTHWSGLLRSALRHCPDFATITEPAPNQDPRAGLCYALVSIFAGEFERARSVLLTIRENPPGDSVAAIGAELALTVIGMFGTASGCTELGFDEIATKAEQQGLPWIARLANGFHRAASISPENMAWWSRSCRGNITHCEEIGDAWGAALLTTAVAISGQHCGHAEASNEFAAAAKRFRELDAPLLQLWCELLPLCGAGNEVALQRVIENSTVVDGRRARALTSALALALAINGITGITAPAVHHVVHAVDTPSPAETQSAVERSADTAVAITCFGSFGLHIDGQPLDLSALRPQARNVLQLLSLVPNLDHRCEFLEDVLWPGVAHSVAAHRLQTAISSVRSAVDSHGIGIERAGDKYRMSLPANAHVDVVEFDDLLSKASVSAAQGDTDGRIKARKQVLDLYTGDLLTDFPSTDHVDAERSRYRRSAAAAAAALASDYQALGESDLAMKAAQRSVELNPEDETSWLIIADLHDAVGDHVAAEHVRREHAQIQAELGA
jgi:DNA-binding SARP family transcriptional activator